MVKKGRCVPVRVALMGCTPDTVFLVKGIAQAAAGLGISRLTVCSPDEESLAVFSRLAVKLASLQGGKLQVRTVTNRVEALLGADLVLADLPGPDPREALVLAETARRSSLPVWQGVGAFGFAEALRAAPSFLRLCELTERYAADGAKVLSLTKPAGVLLQAAVFAGYGFAYGLPVLYEEAAERAAALSGAGRESLALQGFGTPELGVLTSVGAGEQALLPGLFAGEKAKQDALLGVFPEGLWARRGELPTPSFLPYLLRETCAGVRPQQSLPVKTAEAAAQCLKSAAAIEPGRAARGLLQPFCAYLRRQDKLSFLQQGTRIAMQADPFTPALPPAAAVALRAIAAIQGETARPLLLAGPCGETIPGFEPDTVAVCPHAVSKTRVTPLGTPLPSPDTFETLRREFYCQRRLGAALAKGDRAGAAEALAMHPLVQSYETAFRFAEACENLAFPELI